MKKILSLVFISLLLFNVVGYYAIFLGLQYSNDLNMINKLDSEDYTEDETFVVKIPFLMPYASDSKDFERVDGEFQYEGEFYRMVKRKLLKDTLYVVCLKDVMSKRINVALGKYVKTFTDQTADGGSDARATHTLIKDYHIRAFTIVCTESGWVRILVYWNSSPILFSSFYSSTHHPPERA